MKMFVIINYIMNSLLKRLFICFCWYLSGWLEKNKYLPDFLSTFFVSLLMKNVERKNGNNAKQSSTFQNTVCLEKNAHFSLLEILIALILMYT